LAALGVDLASLSAHKLGGPKGVGALYLRAGTPLDLPLGGGHQERGRRPGTENVAGAVGFGAAAACLPGLPDARVASLRERLLSGALTLGARVHGDPTAHVGNTLNLGWEGVPGDLLAMSLDLEGVQVSTGAACTSGSLEPSPVLIAMGFPRARAREAVRLSLGRDNTEEEVARVLELLAVIVPRVRAASAG
jgi:cysteine desulfurase